MNRIRFNIPAALARWRAREPVSQRRFRMMNLQALHEMTLGPGWFDSSWDLGHGLAVEVAMPGDPPFQAWIEAQARPLATVAPTVIPPLPAEGMLEFEPVDWKAWAPVDAAIGPDPAGPVASLDLLELAFEPVPSEAEPELELALA